MLNTNLISLIFDFDICLNNGILLRGSKLVIEVIPGAFKIAISRIRQYDVTAAELLLQLLCGFGAALGLGSQLKLIASSPL